MYRLLTLVFCLFAACSKMSVARPFLWPPHGTLPESIAKASYDHYFSAEDSNTLETYSPGNDESGDYSDLWEKFFLHPQLNTPPGSPQRDELDSLTSDDSLYGLSHMHMMPTSEIFDCEQTSIEQFKDPVLQDCMWSGAERRSGRVRNVSLSELNIISTSTSCIDPTTFTAYPRQHNQVEHNYSLATPEPMKFPKPYSNYNTPSTSENSGVYFFMHSFF